MHSNIQNALLLFFCCVFFLAGSAFGSTESYSSYKRAPVLHHYLEVGGATDAYLPFFYRQIPRVGVTLSYRKEKWGGVKLPIQFRLHYWFARMKETLRQFDVLFGFRLPKSHDLTAHHLDIWMGTALSYGGKAGRVWDLPFKLHIYYTHILGPMDSRFRFFFQAGPYMNLFLKSKLTWGVGLHFGLDMHL